MLHKITDRSISRVSSLAFRATGALLSERGEKTIAQASVEYWITHNITASTREANPLYEGHHADIDACFSNRPRK